MIHLVGRARVFGDDVNTDHIISSSRKRDSIDSDRLAEFLFETLDPEFARSVGESDLIVAGENFGCGSAMEVAVTLLLHVGIRAVLAESFARTYYRNALNNGLVPIQCDTSQIREGDRLAVSIGTAVSADEEAIRIRNESQEHDLAASPFPPAAIHMLEMGGIVPLIAERRGFTVPPGSTG